MTFKEEMIRTAESHLEDWMLLEEDLNSGRDYSAPESKEPQRVQWWDPAEQRSVKAVGNEFIGQTHYRLVLMRMTKHEFAPGDPFYSRQRGFSGYLTTRALKREPVGVVKFQAQRMNLKGRQMEEMESDALRATRPSIDYLVSYWSLPVAAGLVGATLGAGLSLKLSGGNVPLLFLLAIGAASAGVMGKSLVQVKEVYKWARHW